jgi:hypothetical protein
MSEIQKIDKIPDFNKRMHMAARLYAENGIPVVPLRPNSKILPQQNTGINYFSSSSKVETMDKWFGENGKYKGWNLGIVCGREVFVVDLDLHGRENGIENWDDFKGSNELKCPTQKTPTGGQHLIMKWRDNLTSSSGKLAPGVDTRGGDGSPRSHVVAWPSVTPDGAYEWLDGGEVPDAPAWIGEAMGVAWTHRPGRGNEEVNDDDEERQYSIPQVQAMLDHIDPNVLSYEEWLFVGQAINSQHPNPDGLAIWDSWSSSGERYIQGECHKRWTGFSPGGSIRMGSLVYFAKQGGYDASADPARAGEFSEVVSRMNEDNAVLLTGGSVKIVHRDKVGGVHIMAPRDFNTLMYNRKITITQFNAKGNPVLKEYTEAEVWMGAEERRECIRGMGFFPDKPLWHDGYVNIWKGWGVKPEPGNWEMFNMHIKHILCGGDEELHTYVLDWVADIIQDPMNPKGTAIVMHGKEGTGKGTFCELVGKIVGRDHYKHVTNERHLTGNFNYHLMDGLLVFADEVVYGGSRSTAGILKSMVTEKQLVCERKGIDSFMYDNRSRLCVASNEDWFIPAGPESRRWLVLEVDDSKANDRNYFKLLYEQMEEQGGLQAMMHDLLEREITSNLTKAIETEALEIQRSIYKATGDSVDIWLDECIGKEDLGCPDVEDDGSRSTKWPEDVDRMDLFNAYMTWANDKKMRTKGNAHFYRKVEQYGFVKHRPRAASGARKWRYKVPPHEGFDTQS